MGLRDRILDYIAKAFMPVPDHPARGGMTGETDGAGPEDSDGAEAADGFADRENRGPADRDGDEGG